MIDKIVRLAPLLGPMIASLFVVISWYVAHRSNMARDRANKRYDMIVQFLLEAYHRLEIAANREDKTKEQVIAFEPAVTDIQLLGNLGQMIETVKYLEAHASGGGGTIDNVLSLLRDDLRKEFGPSRVNHPLKIFRFGRDWSGGDWRGNPICRTSPVQAQKATQC